MYICIYIYIYVYTHLLMLKVPGSSHLEALGLHAEVRSAGGGRSLCGKVFEVGADISHILYRERDFLSLSLYICI